MDAKQSNQKATDAKADELTFFEKLAITIPFLQGNDSLLEGPVDSLVRKLELAREQKSLEQTDSESKSQRPTSQPDSSH